jgi:5-methylcytosine-specific restriction protein A
MAAYLLTWNPDKWGWEELAQELQEFRDTGALVRQWSCGNRKSLMNGDRVFFLKQGKRGRGLYASGYVQGEVFEAAHFTNPEKTSRYVNVAYDVLLDPDTALLPREMLDQGPLSRVHWSPQGGGMTIPEEAVETLERVWDAHVRSHGLSPSRAEFPDEHDVLFLEGDSRQTTVGAYERSAAARSMCISRKGSTCRVCGLDFGRAYGSIGVGFIHVHHVAQLAGGGRRMTSVDDLEPVCPNCHSMIHRRHPPFGISELREIMRQQGGNTVQTTTTGQRRP